MAYIRILNTVKYTVLSALENKRKSTLVCSTGAHIFVMKRI